MKKMILSGLIALLLLALAVSCEEVPLGPTEEVTYKDGVYTAYGDPAPHGTSTYVDASCDLTITNGKISAVSLNRIGKPVAPATIGSIVTYTGSFDGTVVDRPNLQLYKDQLAALMVSKNSVNLSLSLLPDHSKWVDSGVVTPVPPDTVTGATVTGTEWIRAAKRALAKAIE